MSKNKNLPATVPEGAGRGNLPAIQPRHYWASWDTTQGAGRARMMQMMTVGDMDAAPLVGQTLLLRDVAGWPDTLVSQETGELQAVDYTCLVLADGRYVRTTSQCVRRCIETLIQFYGEPPWAGIPVRLSQRKARNNPGMYLVLTVVDDDTNHG